MVICGGFRGKVLGSNYRLSHPELDGRDDQPWASSKSKIAMIAPNETDDSYYPIPFPENHHKSP